jgi:hypothetical protein
MVSVFGLRVCNVLGVQPGMAPAAVDGVWLTTGLSLLEPELPHPATVIPVAASAANPNATRFICIS